jgi:4-hydroxythreonine-4-phosphate dehydrogenase
MSTIETLLISEGDPAGIGPEIIVRALERIDLSPDRRVVVVGYPGHFDLHRPGVAREFAPLPDVLASQAGGGVLWANAGGNGANGAAVTPGRESEAGSRAAIRSLEMSTNAVLDAPETRALCTAPIHKANLARAGYAYPGHTEYLAARAGVGDFAMLLAIPGLRVVPATIHIPLREVADRLSVPGLERLIRLVAAALPDFGVPRPRIAVAGLNPHAGEEGRFGREEIDIIAPAIERCRKSGIEASGPFPGDTIFHRAHAGEFDVVVAMYHDQGLIPIKTLDFHHGVNVTLGLPFVRTSPDHGVAHDIAGRGIADARSMIAAIETAFGLMRNRRESPERTAAR